MQEFDAAPDNYVQLQTAKSRMAGALIAPVAPPARLSAAAGIPNGVPTLARRSLSSQRRP